MTTSIKCENCGGDIDLSLDNPISFCPYCGKMVKRDENAMDELRLKLRHEEQVRKKKVQEERETEKLQNKRFWQSILGLIGLAVGVQVWAWIMELLKH